MAYNEDLAERMSVMLKVSNDIKKKKMFGGIGFLVNGNMDCGVNKQDLILRISENDFKKALKQPYVRIFNMTGKPMNGWILISSDGYKSDKALLGWIKKGIAYAKSLPPK